ncbi:hypothetical protein [Azospirillum brasilense]|uniref:hypothetical protein n=1 Tax=Azospirillum brasilense TaxID=192 RepID=UPI000E6A3EE0|nr:hypothetical protein [Azospirillum brasilense]NUB24317.1 hypothetical protein [Azospirillum brasilense]NUB34111.1 hypothetical protein [Azospirillum brasilense]RIW01000.1 hypothetical protein D2T81_19510 [Azospirillum brasilense]
MLDTYSLDAQPLDGLGVDLVPWVLTSVGTGRAIDYVYLVDMYPWQGTNGVSYGAPLVLDAGMLDALPGQEEQPPGSIVPLYYADRGYLTAPTDSAAPRRLYEGRVQGFSVERRLPLSPTDSRRVAGTFGLLRLRNDDGVLDSLPDSFAVQGRRVVVRRIIRGQDLSEAVPVFDGVGVAWEPDDGVMGLTVRDRTALADLALLPTYGGTGGKDGPVAWKGKPMPGAFGIARWVPLECYDTAFGLFRCHFRRIKGVTGLWDKGGAYAYVGDYPTEASLKAASLTGGQYATCCAEGIVRAVPSAGGSQPYLGTVTADIEGDAEGGYVETHAEIAQRLLSIGGLGDLVAGGTVASHAAYLPGACGFAWTSQTTVGEAVSTVMQSCASWWGDDRTGQIRLGRLEEPGVPDLELVPGSGLLDVTPGTLPASISPAVWRSTVQYRRCHSVISRDAILATADEATKAFAEREYREAPPSANSLILSRYPTAPELRINSGYDADGPVSDLASYLQALNARSRGVWACKVPLAVAASLWLGRSLRVTWPRHGLAQGRNVRVVALPEDIGDRTATILVWG